MNLSKEKTKIICFSKRTHQVVSVKIDDHTVEHVYLGVILDEKLHFSEHISYACRKALQALNKISLFLSLTNGLNTRNCITLYKALVRPHLEYAFPVWAEAKEQDLVKIDRIQRMTLLRATGCLNSTPTTALEVITNVVLIRLRLQEIVATENIRFLRKMITILSELFPYMIKILLLEHLTHN